MIHPQLLQDCHTLGHMASGTLLLNRNAAIPWFILVPDTDLRDVLDLAPADLAAVTADCARVSAFIKRKLGCSKVNFAGLGNVVPQMHLHIIGRRESDPCWPQPIWGNLAPGHEYDDSTIAAWKETLAGSHGLNT